ncbi:MAG TPA: hypothetical protein VN914_10700 [Polyangia bacterium]|nr:hypothetical protein [Polyangia bacterium]
MLDAYAVIPDGNSAPAAVFVDLEEAIDWGLTRYGSDAFSIKGLAIQPVAADWQPQERQAS